MRNLDKAFDGFFLRCKNGSGKKGYPKFKSRKNGIGSFSLNGSIKTASSTIKLPRIGVVRLKESDYFPTTLRIISATISERCGHWFVSILVDEPERARPLGTETLGVDLGIKSLAVLSDGTTFENPKALKQAERHLRHLNRSLSRKKKGSANYKKAKLKLGKLHYKISCIRRDSINKATTTIAKRAVVLGVESLNVSGMLQNHKLAQAVGDASFSEFIRQLEYKMRQSGGVIVKADQWFPSSKTCSACGFILDTLLLSTREWKCPKCSALHDRDINAACNLRNLAVSSTAIACGGQGVWSPPKKQEPDITCPLWASV